MEMEGKITPTNTPDPLGTVYGKPLLSEEQPEFRFLGRVIVELYESPGVSDTRALIYSIDPAQGSSIDPGDLARRISQALSARVVNIPPSKPK